MVFSIIFLFLVFGYIFQECSGPNYQKPIFLVCLVVLAALAGLRGDVGLDDGSYRLIFSEVTSVGSGVQEPLFNLLVLLLKGLGLGSQSLFVLFAVLSACTLNATVAKIAPHRSVLILIFYFSHRFIHNDLNLIRQGLSSLIFCYSVTVYDKKKILCFLLIILAACIHLPVIIAFGVFFGTNILIYLFKNTSKLTQIIVLSSLFFTLIILGMEFDMNSLDLNRFWLAEKYSSYQLRDEFNLSFNPLFDIVFIKMALILACGTWLVIKRPIALEFRLMLLCLFIGLEFLVVFQSNLIIAKRISSYLFVTEPFVVFRFATEFKGERSYLIKIGVILLAACQLIYNVTWLKVVESYNLCF